MGHKIGNCKLLGQILKYFVVVKTTNVVPRCKDHDQASGHRPVEIINLQAKRPFVMSTRAMSVFAINFRLVRILECCTGTSFP